MKRFKSLFILALASVASISAIQAASPPKQLGAYLEENKTVRGEVVKLDVPVEFVKFELELKKAKIKDPKWFAEHMKKSGKNATIPTFHKKLGISKADYDKYLKIWNKRTYKKVDKGDVLLRLTEESKGNWVINVSGKGMAISLITYNAKDDSFKSSNGVLKRIEDINSPADSIYRAWKGHEWRYFNSSAIVKTKENIAIGRTADTRYGILIYSLQEISGEGTPLADDLMIIRFIPKKIKK